MLKLGVADNNNLKFCADLVEHWKALGHEVKFERGSSEYIAQWADIYWVDTWDNNLAYLYKLYHGDEGVSRTPDWNNDKKPIIVVRALDWEVWLRQYQDQAVIDWVDKAICIAPHIEKELRAHAYWTDKLKLIRPGVNLDKFTLKTKKTDGFQIGMVLGDMWWAKNHMGGLDIFTTLYRNNPKWRLHIRGQHEGGTDYWRFMYDHYLESREIKDVVTLYSPMDEMNEWYENIDILLHPGMKEAFCYAVAEAMAKGIRCVINQFYGSEDIWPHDCLYQTHEEAVFMIKNKVWDKHPLQRRQYIQDSYSNERMFGEIDEFIGL